MPPDSGTGRRAAACRSFTVLAVVLAICLPAAAPSDAGERKEPLPYDLAVEVMVSEGSATENLREEVERALEEDPGLRACYRSVVSDPEEADLVLSVLLLEMDEEIRHELPLAYKQQTRDPDDRMRLAVFLQVIADYRLVLPGDGGTVRSARLDKRVIQRPRYMGDEPRDVALERMLEEMVKRGRSMACKSSARKLQREIRDAGERKP